MAKRQPRLSERAKTAYGAAGDRRYYYRHPCGCVQEFVGIIMSGKGHAEPPAGAKVVDLTEEHRPNWPGHVCSNAEATP